MTAPIPARKRRSTAILVTAFFAVSAYADDDGTEWLVAPYAWVPDISLEQTPGDGGGNISGRDLLDKTDAVGMIRIEAAKNRWGLTLDYIFLDLSETRVISAPGPFLPISVSVVGQLDLTVFELGGVYRPSGEDTGIQFLAGYRGISSDTTVLVTPGGGLTQRVDTDAGLSDVFLGARYLYRYDRWDFSLRGDYSFGESEGVLNVLGSVGFRFNDLFALQGGYRHAVLEYEETAAQGAPTSTEIELSGPFLGLVFRF